MSLVSKFMVYRALSDKTYLLSGLRSPLTKGCYFKNRPESGQGQGRGRSFQIKIIIWKGVPQLNNAAYTKHQEEEETFPNMNHIVNDSRQTK